MAAQTARVMEGGCHCRRQRYRFETHLSPAELPRRACQCAFCRGTGAVSTSDPHGRVHFTLNEPLIRYRFGLKLADFLICGACGIYIAAVMEHDDRRWTVLNANTLDDAGALSAPVTPMDYAGESADQRIARRIARWTPVS